MVFLPFIYVTATAFSFIVLAFPAQSVPTSVSPLTSAKPGTLLGRHYTLHDRTDASNDVGELGQPNPRSDLDDDDRDHPMSRTTRFEYSQRKRRSMLEDGAHGENFLSNVHPEPVPLSTQNSTAHNTSITHIPSPDSTPRVDKAKLKRHKHAVPGAKKSKAKKSKSKESKSKKE